MPFLRMRVGPPRPASRVKRPWPDDHVDIQECERRHPQDQVLHLAYIAVPGTCSRTTDRTKSHIFLRATTSPSPILIGCRESSGALQTVNGSRLARQS